MRQRRVEIRYLRSQPDTILFVPDLLAHAHHAETVGNHDQDDAHIFGKRKEQVMKILGVDGRITGIEIGGFQQTANHQRHLVVESTFHFIECDSLFHHRPIK